MGINFMACTATAHVYEATGRDIVEPGYHTISKAQPLNVVMAIVESKWVRGENNPFDRYPGVELGDWTALLYEWFETNNLDPDDYAFAVSAEQTQAFVNAFKLGVSMRYYGVTLPAGTHALQISSLSSPNAIGFRLRVQSTSTNPDDGYAVLETNNTRPNLPNYGINPASNSQCTQAYWSEDEYARVLYRGFSFDE